MEGMKEDDKFQRMRAEHAPAERRADVESSGFGLTMEPKWPFLITSMDGRMCGLLRAGSTRFLGRSLACLQPNSTEGKNKLLAAATRAVSTGLRQDLECCFHKERFRMRTEMQEDGCLGLVVLGVAPAKAKSLATILSGESLVDEELSALSSPGSECDSTSSRGSELRSRLGDALASTGRGSPDKDLFVHGDECHSVDCFEDHKVVAKEQPKLLAKAASFNRVHSADSSLAIKPQHTRRHTVIATP